MENLAIEDVEFSRFLLHSLLCHLGVTILDCLPLPGSNVQSGLYFSWESTEIFHVGGLTQDQNTKIKHPQLGQHMDQQAQHQKLTLVNITAAMNILPVERHMTMENTRSGNLSSVARNSNEEEFAF